MSTAAARHPVRKLSESGGFAHSPPSSRDKNGNLISLRSDVHVTKGEHAFQLWGVTIPEQYGVDDVLDPALWKHIAIQLRQRSANCPAPGNLIRVVREDGALDAIFRIEDVSAAGYALSFYCGRLPEAT
jgi:hypothetical protein